MPLAHGGAGRGGTGGPELPPAPHLFPPSGVPLHQKVPRHRGAHGAVGVRTQPGSFPPQGQGLPAQRQVREALIGRAAVEDEGERV